MTPPATIWLFVISLFCFFGLYESHRLSQEMMKTPRNAVPETGVVR